MRICAWSTAALVLLGSTPARAQQWGQWLLGSYGLDAGAFPAPGFTYASTVAYYGASRLNDASGSAIAAVSGRYSTWTQQNQFQYVPTRKIFGGYFTPYVDIAFARGSTVADITGTDLGSASNGSGLGDTFVAPVALGWHLRRTDLTAAYGFTAPTGHFVPQGSSNVGSGYWGNNLLVGATRFLGQNRETTANLFVAWEGHGRKKDTRIIPGQALSLEWGFGRGVPLDRQMHRALEVGIVGYDQWRTSRNSGVTSVLPPYAVHAIGAQSNLVLPAANAELYLKYYDEVSATARPQGSTIVFGGSWTLAK